MVQLPLSEMGEICEGGDEGLLGAEFRHIKSELC
jgi:hypothetical protein